MKKSYVALTLVLMVGASGCYGPFALTKKLHKWNGEVGGKWLNEAVFLGLTVLPVYSFAALGDAVIFNSVEFWTGKNPVTAKSSKSLRQGDAEAVVSYSPDTRRLRVDSFEKGRPVSTVVLEPAEEGMIARDSAGKTLMTAKTENGFVVLADASGKIVGKYDPAKVETSR